MMKEKIPYEILKQEIDTVKFDNCVGETIYNYNLKNVYCTVGKIPFDCNVEIIILHNTKVTLEMFSFLKFINNIKKAAVEEIPEIINIGIRKVITFSNLSVAVKLKDDNHSGIEYIKNFENNIIEKDDK